MSNGLLVVDAARATGSAHWFLSFSKELVISTVGGFVGGALAYGWYIERKENRKNEMAKRSACTKALLTTQTVLMLQTQELNELKMVCEKIVNFEFLNDTLGNMLKSVDTVSISKLLDKIGKTGKSHDLFRATQFIIMKPSSNHVINMPHDIFDIKDCNLKSQPVPPSELTQYFQDLASCNRGYMKIISLLERHNETRDMVYNQLISTPEIDSILGVADDAEKLKYLSVVFAMTKISLDILQRIDLLLKKINAVFAKSECYIKNIGLSESIELADHQQ